MGLPAAAPLRLLFFGEVMLFRADFPPVDGRPAFLDPVGWTLLLVRLATCCFAGIALGGGERLFQRGCSIERSIVWGWMCCSKIERVALNVLSFRIYLQVWRLSRPCK